MEGINYSEINGKDVISKELEELFGEYVSEELEFAENVQIREVKSPFILADNDFDLREANNMLEVFGVVKTEQFVFTGGGIAIVYEKVGKVGYIVHGNDEEGYNIFKLV